MSAGARLNGHLGVYGRGVRPCVSERRLACVLVLSTLVGSGSGSYYWAGTVQPRGTLRRRE